MHNVPQTQVEDHMNINQGRKPEILEIGNFYISFQTLFFKVLQDISQI